MTMKEAKIGKEKEIAAVVRVSDRIPAQPLVSTHPNPLNLCGGHAPLPELKAGMICPLELAFLSLPPTGTLEDPSPLKHGAHSLRYQSLHTRTVNPLQILSFQSQLLYHLGQKRAILAS